MPKLQTGDKNLFQVGKKTDDGYILIHDEGNILLPFNECDKELSVGDFIEAFLYIDHSKGFVATTKTPYIDMHQPDFVKVVEKKEGLGVFVDVGLSKDMLVSKDDLPYMKKHWPNKGDTLLCYLKTAKRQMVARPVSRFKVKEFIKPSEPLEEGQKVELIVFRVDDEGVVAFTKEGHEIFIYYKHTRKQHRVGEVLDATITVKRDDAHYNATLIEQKESMLETDAQRILDYIKESGGTIPLTDKSSPDDIFNAFNMSKAAFKRALGRLFKEGYVVLNKQSTDLKNSE